MDSLNRLLDVDCRYKQLVQDCDCLNFVKETLELPLNKTSRLLTSCSFCSYHKEF